MTRKQLETRLRAIAKKHADLHGKTVDLINEYMKQHPEGVSETQQADPSGPWNIERMVEDSLFHGSWIQDRLAGVSGFTASDSYKKSLTKKIRKALGYTL